MLSPYYFPVGFAFLTFPIAALLFTLPFLIIQYRRHGYINKLRGFLLYLFLLYLMNAIYLVLLPLPATRHNELMLSQIMQLVPFTFIDDILQNTSVDLSKPLQYIHFFRETAFLHMFFNILLTVPFGIFMRYYFRFRWFSCLVATFALSFFFEVTQLTGIYGYFDHPYRLFDVDDLILNTLGGMVGYLIAEMFSSKLPRIDKLDDSLDLSSKRVSYTRRGLAFMIDSVIMLPVLAVTSLLFNPVYGFLFVFAYHLLVPFWTNGRSAGRSIVRIAITGREEKLRFKEILIRQSLLYSFVGLNFMMVLDLATTDPTLAQIFFSSSMLIFNVAVFIHVMGCLFNHQRQPWHERVSGTSYRITSSTTTPPHHTEDTETNTSTT